jgi:hypothetical protein
VRITTPVRPGATPGDFFLAPYEGQGTPGEMIVDQGGDLVWFKAAPPHEISTNFRVQWYAGHTVLTWWQGRAFALGFGHGEDDIYNTSYQPVARVLAGNGYQADLHEFLLTQRDTAWIDAYDPVVVDLSKMGGSPHGVVNDCVVQQVDVKTGLVMWEWHALGHIPLADSYRGMPHTTDNWDYVHINSIDPGTHGDLLLSGRSTWAIYDVNLASGAIIWQLGGRGNNFKHGPAHCSIGSTTPNCSPAA